MLKQNSPKRIQNQLDNLPFSLKQTDKHCFKEYNASKVKKYFCKINFYFDLYIEKIEKIKIRKIIMVLNSVIILIDVFQVPGVNQV